MKGIPAERPYLNLYNFDTPEFQGCPYVLTSPRSLEACRRLGIKPVELLYKSVEEYEEELIDTSLSEVYRIYDKREKERQASLETCRSLRKQLMKSEDEEAEGGRKSQAWPKPDDYVDRKQRLDWQNRIRAAQYSGADNVTSAISLSSAAVNELPGRQTSSVSASLHADNRERRSGSRTSSAKTPKSPRLPTRGKRQSSAPHLKDQKHEEHAVIPSLEQNEKHSNKPVSSDLQTAGDAANSCKGEQKKQDSDKQVSAACLPKKIGSPENVGNEFSKESYLTDGKLSTKNIEKKDGQLLRFALSSDELPEKSGEVDTTPLKNDGLYEGKSINQPSCSYVKMNSNSGEKETGSVTKERSRGGKKGRLSSRPSSGRSFKRYTVAGSRAFHGSVSSLSSDGHSASGIKKWMSHSHWRSRTTDDQVLKLNSKTSMSASDLWKVEDVYNLSPRQSPGPWMKIPSVKVADVEILRRSFQGSHSLENLFVSEHDRRILETMAMKKEQEMETELVAHRVRLAWEEEREHKIQADQERLWKWRLYVSEKRQKENKENEWHLQKTKEEFQKSQEYLGNFIQEKEERSQALLHQIKEKRRKELLEKQQQHDLSMAKLQNTLLQLIEEQNLYWKIVGENQERRMQNAEKRRRQKQEVYRRFVANANQSERLRHEKSMQRVEQEAAMALQEIQHSINLKEERASLNYSQIVQNRNKKMQSQSLQRASQFLKARKMQAELNEGLEKWHQQVLALQCAAIQRAQIKAMQHLEAKRQRLEHDRYVREVHHLELRKRILAEEKAQEQQAKHMLHMKDTWIQLLHDQRKERIEQSRVQAQTTADLREHLRQKLSPETFDKKVARAALELQVSSRPPSGRPPMHRSHIFLG